MKEIWRKSRKWLLPALPAILGVILMCITQAHSFLALICYCAAAVIACYELFFLIKRKHRKLGKILIVALSVCLCIGLLMFMGAEVLVLQASAGDPANHCEYIVVLGAKVNGTSPSYALSDRIQAAAAYLKANPDTVAVLSGGKGTDESISEAQCMFQNLVELGVSPERLWLEDRSTSTWENIVYSLDLIEEKTGVRPDTLGLITSDYHIYRAKLFAKDCGVTPVGIPARTGGWFSVVLNYFLREAAGVWHYLILGG